MGKPTYLEMYSDFSYCKVLASSKFVRLVVPDHVKLKFTNVFDLTKCNYLYTNVIKFNK